MRVKDLCAFIRAREAARLGKGKDPIIAKYRFCNVRRNDDRVTKAIFGWSSNYHDHPELWFALVIARLFNNAETLEEIKAFVLPFKPEKMRQVLHFRKERGAKNFNAAYIVSTNGRRMDKVDYLIQEVIGPLWVIRKNITASLRGATLAQAHELLLRQNGLGSFMAAQVLADLKYLSGEHYEDFDTFAASGPGSKRGLNRVQERPVEQPRTEAQFRVALTDLREAVNKTLKWEEPLTAQDLQNCLCEFDKYERARTGEGEPKQLYRPHQGV